MVKKYGKAPFNIVMIHGGPGAAGEMAPVAKELSKNHGVLEPFQTKLTIKEQLQELKDIVQNNASIPVILIGYSWGSMLSFIFAAKNPQLVKKLILISSAVFDDKYAENIKRTRLARMTLEEESEMKSLFNQLNNSNEPNKNIIFAKLGKLISKIDSYNPISDSGNNVECRYDIYKSVWDEAIKFRASGQLLLLGKQILCPVVAIHGDYDPHPAEGINVPLSNVVKNFRFILLKHCGHCPWKEKEAKKEFYKILQAELD